MAQARHYANAAALMRYQHQSTEARPAPAAVRQLRDRLKRERPQGSAESSWFEIPDELRALLVALCTDHPQERAHMLKWSDLSETEQIIIGTQARSFVRGLGAVAERLR